MRRAERARERTSATRLPSNDKRFQVGRNLVKSRVLPAVFHAGQRFGFDLLPRHFYSEIPDIRRLRRSPAWQRPLDMERIRGADIDDQAKNFEASMPDGAKAVDRSSDIYMDACRDAGYSGFGPTEAVALFGFILAHRPTNVVQIGAGVSTAVVLRASELARYRPAILCVEPNPTPFLRGLHDDGRIELVERGAQDAGSKERALAEMRPGGLLFVDSTHTLGPGGEVTRLVGEWLPALPASTWAHFHDIHLPFDYHPDVLTTELFFWHETAAVYLFLSLNDRFEIYYAMSMLHHERPDVLASAISRYSPTTHDAGNLRQRRDGHYPSSLYLRG